MTTQDLPALIERVRAVLAECNAMTAQTHSDIAALVEAAEKQTQKASRGLSAVLRKHIEPMIAEARAHGRTGEDIYNPDDPPVVSPADDAYAKLVISALTPSPEEGG